MSRSTKKGPYIHPSLEKRVMAMRGAANKTMMICCGGCKGDKLVLDI